MKRIPGILAAAGAVVFGPQAVAGPNDVSLQQAVNNLLANGCQGTVDPRTGQTIGLLTAGDFAVSAPVSTFSNLTTSFTYDAQGRNSDLNTTVSAPIFTGPVVDDSGAPLVDASGVPLAASASPYPNAWRSPSTAPISVTAAFANSATPAVDIRVALTIPGILRDSNGDPVRTGGVLQQDPARPICDPGFGGANTCNRLQNGDQFPGFLPQVANPVFNPALPDDVFNRRFLGASSLTVRVTPTYTETTTAARTVRSGLVGNGLGVLCGSQATRIQQISGATADVTFSFNDSAGTRVGAPPAVSITPGSGGASIGSSSGQGQTSSRAQDAIVRREKGLSAFFERLKRKASQKKRPDAVVVASNDPAFMPYFDDTPSATFVADVSGGAFNIDRARTDLEGGFSADSVVINAGAGVLFDSLVSERDQLLFGLAAGYEDTESVSEAALAADRNTSESTAWTGSAYASWTSAPLQLGFKDPGFVSVALAGLYGEGDQTYDRTFTARYLTQTTVSGGVSSSSFASVSEDLRGQSDQSFNSVSLQLSAAQSFGPLTVSPRGSFSSVRFKTGGYSESGGGTTRGGLALTYAPVADQWTETRIGAGAVLRTFASEALALDVGVGVDTIFIGDASTPKRVAYFAEDLRANRVPIRYSVDDLDSQYYDVNASVTATFGNGVEAFLNGFSRQGHSYIDVTGAVVGVRIGL